jgi:hypothetical protein
VALLVACGGPPTAPALSDPKEIVTKGVTSLAGVKSFEFTGTFTGNVTGGQLGTFDLSSVALAGAVDIPNQAAKLSLDAPSILGTKIDAIVTGGNLYFKTAGAAAIGLGGSADKYTKVAVPSGSANPISAATDMTKVVADLQTMLAALPVQPTKAADERCSDQDCYHVTLKLSGDQLRGLSPTTPAIDGDVTLDLLTRKSDYRPGRIAISTTSPSLGSIGMTIDLKYDVSVSVQAPAADQIAP